MTARIKISQAGLAAGVAGKARTDGLATGALVTLEDVTAAGVSTFVLLWAPPEDTTAEASLAVTGNPKIWTFSPTAAAYGSYLIELRVDGVPTERRVFGIRTPANQLLIPALNERGSRLAGLHNDGADQIDLSNNNADDFPDAALNTRRYAGWWRSLRELYEVVEFGTGSIADHAIALIKLATAPAKSVIANATNASGDAAYLSGSAAFQYLRVNSANTGLEWATISAASIAPIAAKTVLANATNASAAPTALAGSAAFQHLRVNSANNALEWATIGPSAIAPIAAKSVIANATNGSLAPTDLAGSTAHQYLRVTGANTGLEWATLADGVKTAATVVSAATTVLATTNTYAIPANTLAVGSRFKCEYTFQFIRGGTATALGLGCFFDVGAGTISVTPTSQTAAATYQMRVVAEVTILSLGAGGTCMVALSAFGDAITAGQAHAPSNIALAIDTTVANNIRGAAQMNAAVAGTSITATGGHLLQVN